MRRSRDARFRIPGSFRVRALSTEASTDTVAVVTPGAVSAGLAPDRDRDDLTDAEEAIIGTDPDNRDTDGDALWDGWEVHTIDGLDLHSLGASPLHKDIFVEMDFMQRASATNGLGPSDAVLRGIEAVFAAAPVSNPDGRRGIDIHLIMGNEVPYDADLNPYFTEFARLRNSNFDPKRARAFHYMIWANGYGGGTSSGISMDIPHSEFIVSLGTWNNNRGGTDTQKIGTFIHELGHNLGRKHGGSDHKNYKANHLSVMNYLFQTRGVLRNGTRVFDYQPFALPGLDERNLMEADGFGGNLALVGYSALCVLPGGSLKDIDCHGPIDWNGNNTIDAVGVSVDLNQDTLLEEMLETPDEWAALVFNGGVIGERFPVGGILERSKSLYDELPVVELTEDMDKTIENRIRDVPGQP
ncbi:MAG TPA: hypothetical protein VJT09_04925 [Pyrinomonadaceae bacterium]|nr:hypothetical protein [Pyrinomonadaceae bacterium]